MVEGAHQEGYFWESDSWVMSGKSSGGFGKGDSGKRSPDNKNLIEPSMDNNNASEMKLRLDMQRGTSGSSDGSKRNNDTSFAAKNDEDDKKKVISRNKGKREGVEPANEHELHIWTERERRKKMRSMFQQLHALIPQLPPKTDKSTIVDEAVSYIKTLQQTVQKLERKKLERLYGVASKTTIASPIDQQSKMAFGTRESFLADQGSSTSEISPSSSTSFPFPLRSPTVFETWASSNVTLNVCGLDAHFSILCSPKPGLLTAVCFVFEKHNLEIVSAQISSDQVKSLFMIHAHANTQDRFAETSPYDEIYKKAATEIMHWVNSK
uniref:transcription factor bHLH95-like n=1 Tax=Erigeron canadensis TaxID=72917 RepID=UPI001CB99678|nr:transcription factor bHLH95-like [Erigeron canadensis]